MTTPDQTPKLPTWIFIVTDLVLLGAAGVIAYCRPHPFSDGTTIAIVACVILGAIVGLIPLVANYEREKNETLDERQRSLEGLARTLSSAAEQISIAAGGLHEVADLAQKNLRHAEQLPQKLQEKISAFQAQLAAADDAEKEELEKEIVALRTSESERLEAISDKIFKSSAEWAKLEATARQHLAASKDMIERAAAEAAATLTAATAAAINDVSASAARTLAAATAASTAEAEQSLIQAQARATTELGEQLAAVTRTLASATADALAAIESKLAASAEQAARTLSAAVAALPPRPSAPAPASGSDFPSPEPVAPSPAASLDSPTAEPTAHPPKRPRKPRREAPAPEEPPTPLPADDTPPPPAPVADEPAPVSLASIPEIAPVAPATENPFTPVGDEDFPAPADPEPASVPEPEPTPEPAPSPVTPPEAAPPPPPAAEAAPPAAEDAEADESPTAARQRPPKAPPEPEPDPEPALDLEIDDTPAPQSAELAEVVLTSDGATRLIVTAYIGIGNRLFIRGEGPGLSWEKGVPLQFVSIGKWRWETSDADAPVRFKLYKNDTVECTALGIQTLDPGHQQDLTASF